MNVFFKWGLSAGVAVLINILVFAIFPALTREKTSGDDIFHEKPILLTQRIKPNKPETKPSKKLKINREKPPVTPPKKPVDTPARKLEKTRLNFSLPKTEFQVNSRIKAGVSVSKPEPGVKVMAPVKPGLPDMVFELGQLDVQPVKLRCLSPIYPYMAKRRNIEGNVLVSFVIDREGKVRDIKILKSNPKGIFDKVVLKTVSGWIFKPAIKNGQKVKTRFEYNVDFSLN